MGGEGIGDGLEELDFEARNGCAFAGAEAGGFNSELLQDLNPEITEGRRVLWIEGEVTTVFEAAASDEDGEVGGVVAGSVAHGGA